MDGYTLIYDDWNRESDQWFADRVSAVAHEADGSRDPRRQARLCARHRHERADGARHLRSRSYLRIGHGNGTILDPLIAPNLGVHRRRRRRWSYVAASGGERRTVLGLAAKAAQRGLRRIPGNSDRSAGSHRYHSRWADGARSQNTARLSAGWSSIPHLPRRRANRLCPTRCRNSSLECGGYHDVVFPVVRHARGCQAKRSNAGSISPERALNDQRSGFAHR